MVNVLFKSVVVDASVFADYYLFYPRRPERYERARAVIDEISRLGLLVYEPFLFEIELKAVLVRRIDPKQVLNIVAIVLNHINIVDEKEIHNKAAEIALLTGCRAVDAYYIATAKHVNAILITNDKVMKYNASKAGAKAYYLLEEKEYEALMMKLKNSKQNQ